MAKTITKQTPKNKRPPAMTPEAKEEWMINLAIAQAEKQLAEGNAPAQVVTFYLKLGSTKERIEKEILAKQKDLIEAKTDVLKSTKRMEELYADALQAMRRYSGVQESEEDPEEDDE